MPVRKGTTRHDTTHIDGAYRQRTRCGGRTPARAANRRPVRLRRAGPGAHRHGRVGTGAQRLQLRRQRQGALRHRWPDGAAGTQHPHRRPGPRHRAARPHTGRQLPLADGHGPGHPGRAAPDGPLPYPQHAGLWHAHHAAKTVPARRGPARRQHDRRAVRQPAGATLGYHAVRSAAAEPRTARHPGRTEDAPGRFTATDARTGRHQPGRGGAVCGTR